MISYVALLRGIMPMNKETRNENLRKVFEDLGFKDVHTIISSGNVIFKSKSKSIPLLENKLEKKLAEQLNFKTSVIVRSRNELEQIIQLNPFKGKEHNRSSYLIVTFLKNKPRELFNIIDTTKTGSPDFMAKIEKQHGKIITTRTWNTVNKIVNKMNHIA
jgi:uncharacterized protein (DUF1697 family)